MSCIGLRNDLDVSCKDVVRKYFQQIVLVNKDDIEAFLIQTPINDISGYECRYSLSFRLKEDATGYRITNTYNGGSVFGFYTKTKKEGIPQYKHSVQFTLIGADEETRCFLYQLDRANYFAAVQLTDGTVEIYGFEFGLQTEDYEINIANNSGGALIVLSSDDDVLEDNMPYIYLSGISGDEGKDFDNNFVDNPELPSGDFNDDFNDDFNNG